MKIVIINHSDTRGGASVVSMRLLGALVDAGADATMLVVHKDSSSPLVVKAAPAWRARLPFLAEHIRIFLANGFDRSDLFKISIATDGLPLSSHPLVRQADAVILGWVNQGMISLSEIERIARMGKRIIWTMHDMWNITGICHHAATCEGYRMTPGCGACPLIHRKPRPDDLSRRAWQRKLDLYRSVPIAFVAVSRWLAGRCSLSSLMAGCQVTVIPNAFPVEQFSTEPTTIRADLGLPEGKIILMGAARLDDPVKGLPYAIEALNRLPHDAATAVFFGDLRDPSALDGLQLPHIHFGPVKSHDTLRELYAHASVVLSSSLYETLPGTLIEGMAAGCHPVTFGEGGQADILTHGQTGYIARHLDADDLANGLRQALADPISPAILRAATAKFSPSAIARQYLDLLAEGQ